MLLFLQCAINGYTREVKSSGDDVDSTQINDSNNRLSALLFVNCQTVIATLRLMNSCLSFLHDISMLMHNQLFKNDIILVCNACEKCHYCYCHNQKNLKP